MAYLADYWNGPAAERWLREQAGLDRMLSPFGEAALDAAAVQPGEAALDVGCGCGQTLLRLAELVGPRGRVVGVDPSAPMLARARERCAACSCVSLVEGDAASAPFASGSFDALFSRFGVMFFPDPRGAFRHLFGALRHQGRLAFVCWRPLAENQWARIPFDAVAEVLGRPEPPPPDAPGPFSFADPARVRSILAGAGFQDIAVRGFEAMGVFGQTGSLDEAVREVAMRGPVGRLLADRDEASVARGTAAIRAALQAHVTVEGQVHLLGAVWVVTARRP
jgi:SAM-dependent methyltransferase